MSSRDDFIAIQQAAALYGHVIDNREWERLGDVYAGDAVYDRTGVGGVVIEGGLAAIVEYLSSSEQPLAHHVTNVVIERWSEDFTRAEGRAKWFVVRRDLSVRSGEYVDSWTKTQRGWRLQRRASRVVAPSS